jgi:hypothetical protein
MAGASRGGNALLVSSPEEAAISEGFSAIAAPVPLHASNSVYGWIDWSEKAIEFLAESFALSWMFTGWT